MFFRNVFIIEHLFNLEQTYKFFDLHYNNSHSAHNFLNFPSLYFTFPSTQTQLPSPTEINTIYYSSNEQILFICQSLQKANTISFIESLFTSKQQQQPQSEIILYKVSSINNNYNNNTSSSLTKITSFPLLYKATSIYYIIMSNRNYNYLFISFITGAIAVYTLSLFPNQMHSITNIEQQYIMMHIHKHPIINFCIDKSSGYIYSIAQNEPFLMISEFNYGKVIMSIPLFDNITSFTFDNENMKLFLTDKDSSLYVYQITKLTEINLIQVVYNELCNSFCKVYIECERNFIFISSGNVVKFYDYNELCNKGWIDIKERISFKINTKHTEISDVKYRDYKGEVIVSTFIGVIEIWAHSYNVASFIMRIDMLCGMGEIIGMIIGKKNNLLIVNGKKKVMGYKLCERYIAEDYCDNNCNYMESIFENETGNNNNISLIKDAFARMSFNEDMFSEGTNDDSNMINTRSNSCLCKINNYENNTNINQNNINDNCDEDSNESYDSYLDGWDE